MQAIENERFPGLDQYGYGSFQQESTMPIVDRQISATQAKWTEVVAVAGARRLVWSRPAGTRYLVSGPNHTSIYNDQAQACAETVAA